MAAIGQTLSHYKIVAKLGQGGVGEFYQATDLKLGRDVALKVLPEEFARDSDCAARFQREAKLLASLNHPNIAAIYGLEEYGGINFLVLNMVEGETLADQLRRGDEPWTSGSASELSAPCLSWRTGAGPTNSRYCKNAVLEELCIA